METRKPFTVTEDILASHAQRFMNLLLDMVMQFILLFVVLVFITGIALSNGNKDFVDKLATNDIALYTIVACISLFYYNVFEIFSARTVGKFITQTLVVNENGEAPDHQTILIRSICRLIPFNALSFLGIPARGWHDSISKTYVVDKKLLNEKKRLFYTPQPTTVIE